MDKSLTPHEVEQLVSLRLGLEDAVAAANYANKYRRGAAIVALDAVVERASAIVAVTRGLTLPTNGKLDNLISRLRQDMGAVWRPSVLPDVKLLRRARNAAQHDGLDPDRDRLPAWASAVETYVTSLIDAEFSVDIRRIVLSDAIEDDELRASIRAAEQAFETGENGSSIKSALKAYDSALAVWTKLRRGGLHHSVILLTDAHVDAHVKAIQDLTDASAFSTNPADAHWFVQARRENLSVLDTGDTERIVSFVFEWITGYEQSSSTWATNRTHRANVAARRVRSDNSSSYIDSCEIEKFTPGSSRIVATFRIGNVPLENEYPDWKRMVHNLLRKSDSSLFWIVHDNGTITADEGSGQVRELTNAPETLSRILTMAEQAIHQQKVAAEQRSHEREQQRAMHAAAVESIRAEFPDWVESVKCSVGVDSDRDIWLVTVSDLVWQLKFGGGRRPSYREDIRYLVQSLPQIDYCMLNVSGHTSALEISPVVNAMTLVDALKTVDPRIQEGLTHLRQEAAHAHEDLVATRAAIASIITRIRYQAPRSSNDAD